MWQSYLAGLDFPEPFFAPQWLIQKSFYFA